MNSGRFRSGVTYVAALLVSSLLLSRIHPFGNPALFAGKRRDDLQGAASLPAAVRTVVLNKCADCHGRGVPAPIYGHFAPASWVLERDIVRARAAFDISKWQDYSTDTQETLRSQIGYEARAHRMPPLQYVAIHRDARLTEPEIRILEDWAEAATDSKVPGVPGSSVAGDAARGELVFKKRCAGCHALADNREGPRLRDVYGRRSASVPGFDYSDALRNAAITWNDDTLEKWLTDTDSIAPGNNMSFRVVRPQERADVIRYLRQLSGH